MDYLNITPEERQAMRREWLEMFRSELSPEERMAGLGPEERLAGLSPEEIEAYLKKMRRQKGH